MGVVGKYNCRAIFKSQSNTPDGYGGEVQSFGYSYQEGVIYKVRGRLRPSKSDRMMVETGAVQETVYNLEIRANVSWRPKKGMIVGVDDGYRVFEAVVTDIRQEDMKRKYWDIQILEVE